MAKLHKGYRSGRLVLLHPITRNEKTLWLCQCDCGISKEIPQRSLEKKRKTQSCGCLWKERFRDSTKKHGMSRTKEHNTWLGIKSRCLNPKPPAFKDYGGRGITMHPAWASDFESFLEYVGKCPSDGLTIDRIDNDKGYEPGNVRWATRREQAKNRRSNILVTVDGKRMTITDASPLVGLSAALINFRLKSGWSEHDALYRPRRKHPSRPESYLESRLMKP